MKKIKNKKCYLCGSDNIFETDYKIRDSKALNVLKCAECSLLFLSSFNHIDNDFYRRGEMHKAKLTPQQRLKISQKDDKRRYEFLKPTVKNNSLLDFGCGAGGFLELVKNDCSKIAGVEKEEVLKTFLVKNNFNVYDDIKNVEEKFDIITMFHVFEHLKNPKDTIKETLNLLNDKGQIIIEIPNEDDILISLYNLKSFINFTHWSCHLFYWREKTIKRLLNDLNVKINYIKPTQRYGLNNHLYWLIKGERGGHNKWKVNSFLNRLYINFLKLIHKTDTLIISISKK